LISNFISGTSSTAQRDDSNAFASQFDGMLNFSTFRIAGFASLLGDELEDADIYFGITDLGKLG
jgi:hypothetical protein